MVQVKLTCMGTEGGLFRGGMIRLQRKRFDLSVVMDLYLLEAQRELILLLVIHVTRNAMYECMRYSMSTGVLLSLAKMLGCVLCVL